MIKNTDVSYNVKTNLKKPINYSLRVKLQEVSMFSFYDINSFPQYLSIKYKRHAFALSLLFFICGTCCLVFPYISGLYIAFGTGMAFMVSGFYSIYGLFIFNQKYFRARITTFIYSILCVCLGMGFIINPETGVDSLGFLFGILFLFCGIIRASFSFRNITSPGSKLLIIISALDIIIAVIWLIMPPDMTFSLTTAFIGIELLFYSFGFYYIKNINIDASEKKSR